jgi:hypothetical protein
MLTLSHYFDGATYTAVAFLERYPRTIRDAIRAGESKFSKAAAKPLLTGRLPMVLSSNESEV